MIHVTASDKDKCFECHEPAALTISVEKQTGVMWLSFCHKCSDDLFKTLDHQIRKLDLESYYS